MTRKYWKGGKGALGAGSDDIWGQFDEADNWQLAGGGATVAPVNGDVIVFDKRAGIVPSDYAEGTPKHTIGKHWNCYFNTAATGLALDGLIITEDFTGNIGYNAQEAITPLEVAVVSVVFRSGESAYLEADAGDIPTLVFDSDTGYLRIGSDEGTSQWAEVICSGGGTLEAQDSAAVDKIICTADFDGTLTIGESVDDEGGVATDLDVYAGTVYCNSKLGTVKNAGGTIEFGKTDLALTNVLDITSLLQILGTFRWRVGGTLKAATIVGGIVEAVGDGDKEMGDGADNTIELLGGKLDASGQGGKFTLEGTSDLLVHGQGIFVPPPEHTYTWAPVIVD